MGQFFLSLELLKLVRSALYRDIFIEKRLFLFRWRYRMMRERESEEKANRSSRKKVNHFQIQLQCFLSVNITEREFHLLRRLSSFMLCVWTIGNTPRISEFFNRLSSSWKLCAFENFLVAFPPTSQSTHTHYIYNIHTRNISAHFQFVCT